MIVKILKKLQDLEEDPNIQIEDFYFTERVDMDGEIEWPVGTYRLFYYVKYTNLEEQKIYEEKRE